MDLMEWLLFSISCWKYAYIQHVPKRSDHSNSSNYRPIALLSWLSKAFETILNTKILKHLPAFNFLYDRQYGFRKGRSTGDLLAFHTNSCSSSLSHFGETFAVALDMPKAFDRVWHKSLVSELQSFSFYPSLCTFISSLLSGPCISAIVDGHCFTPKPINSGVPQGSVLSSTLFLLFINDLSITICPLHSYAGGSTLHYSTSLSRRPTSSNCTIQGWTLQDAWPLTSLLFLNGARGTWSPLMPENPVFPFINSTTSSRRLSPILRIQIPVSFSNNKHP